MKKKVVFVIPSLRAGGAERITHTMASHLPTDRYIVAVIVVNAAESFFEMPPQITVVDLGKKSVTAAAFSIVKEVNQQRPDVVISMITHLNTLVGLFSFLYSGSPKVVLRETNVLSELFTSPLSIRRRIRKMLTKLGYRFADVIMCQSNFMANDVTAELQIQRKKCQVVHNPVTEASVSESISDYDLVALGNLTPVKGYHRLINIMKKLRGSGLKLAIIGDGVERKKLEKSIAENHLQGQVDLLGFQKDPHKYLVGAKMLVMTSIMESFSNAVLEAGIHGTPTVAYDMPGGMNEIIQDGINGYLIENGNEEAFVKAVCHLANNQLNKWQIIKYTKKNFSIETIMEQFEKQIL